MYEIKGLIKKNILKQVTRLKSDSKGRELKDFSRQRKKNQHSSQGLTINLKIKKINKYLLFIFYYFPLNHPHVHNKSFELGKVKK